MKKIIMITGSRAEYGLLKNLIILLKNDKKIKLKLVVTGSHLSKKFGLTTKEIKADGIKVEKKIKILNASDTQKSISKYFADGVVKFTEYLSSEKPDSLIILGDRYEIFAAAISASFLNIPIYHINGGDSTEGAIDEFMRHSITKMSWLHFVSNLESKKRILRMGENPSKVFLVGSLGVERMKKLKLLKKKILEKKLNIDLNKKTILVTYHPETKLSTSPKKDFSEILYALSNFKDFNIIFTAPNADSQNELIIKMIKKFIKKNNNSHYYKSLGFHKYASLLKHIHCVLGNSSSGIIETPTFKIPSIDIGDRQKGRIFASSTLNCLPKKNKIIKLIKKVLSLKFRKSIIKTKNPYDIKNTSAKIYGIIKNSKKPENLKKKFYFNEKVFN